MSLSLFMDLKYKRAVPRRPGYSSDVSTVRAHILQRSVDSELWDHFSVLVIMMNLYGSTLHTRRCVDKQGAE